MIPDPSAKIYKGDELISIGGYYVGDLVLMKPIPEEPDEPQERLVLLAFDELSWGISVMGCVPVEHRAEGDWDGLREFTLDQIERKLS